MKEYPILFSTEMVRAILDGRKTQSRRVILPQPKIYVDAYNNTRYSWHNPATGTGILGAHNEKQISETIQRGQKSRYGQPGDTIWVRESFFNGAIGYDRNKQEQILGNFSYKADYQNPLSLNFKPSIHMPREAARLFLRNEGEKIERLQDISEADAIAEGIKIVNEFKEIGTFYANYDKEDIGTALHPITSFSTLWNSINFLPKPAKRNPYTGEKEACYISFPWEDIRATETYRGKTHYIIGNPWVRAISFSKIEKI